MNDDQLEKEIGIAVKALRSRSRICTSHAIRVELKRKGIRANHFSILRLLRRPVFELSSTGWVFNGLLLWHVPQEQKQSPR